MKEFIISLRGQNEMVKVLSLLRAAAQARPKNVTLAKLVNSVENSPDALWNAEHANNEILDSTEDMEQISKSSSLAAEPAGYSSRPLLTQRVAKAFSTLPVFARQGSHRPLWFGGLVAVFGLTTVCIFYTLFRYAGPVVAPSVPTIAPLLIDGVSKSIVRHIAFTDKYIWLTVKDELGIQGPTVGLLQLDLKTGVRCFYRRLLDGSRCQNNVLIDKNTDSVAAIWADDEEIYAGINQKGVVRGLVGTLGNTIFSELFSLPDVQVMSMHKDKRDTLWVGTTDGLYRAKDGTVKHYASIDQFCQLPASVNHAIAVRDIAEDSDGIWLATNVGAIYLTNGGDAGFCYQEDAVVQCQSGGSLIENDTWSVHVGSDDSVWIGTLNGRVSHLERANQQELSFNNCWLTEKLPDAEQQSVSNRVHALQTAHDGNLWAATVDGLFFRSADEQKWSYYRTSESLMALDVECLLEVCAYGTSRGLYMTRTTR